MAQWNVEVTDTFDGESNYSWVRRYTVTPRTDSDLALIRAVKRILGWSGHPCRVERYGDSFAIYPRGVCQVAFVDWPQA